MPFKTRLITRHKKATGRQLSLWKSLAYITPVVESKKDGLTADHGEYHRDRISACRTKHVRPTTHIGSALMATVRNSVLCVETVIKQNSLVAYTAFQFMPEFSVPCFLCRLYLFEDVGFFCHKMWHCRYTTSTA